MLVGCIHEFPIRGLSPRPGNDPTVVNTIVEIHFELPYQYIDKEISFSSRARTDNPHRFIIEVSHEGKIDCRDIVYISDREFSSGLLKHTLSTPLRPDKYYITAWYDLQDDEGEHAFDAENFSDIKLVNTSSTDSEIMRCLYGRDFLDIRESLSEDGTNRAIKILEMKSPGARFEIIATDVVRFITLNKDALNQRDKFTTHLLLTGGGTLDFNSYNETPVFSAQSPEFTGRMRLPFDEYDELTIAEGFIFCLDEDEASMILTVKNSALINVSRTEPFYFPVKRGYLTRIRGEFLTNAIDGVFDIDHIWEGEIIKDITE